MASPSRTAQYTRLQKILKKHYRPVAPDPGRSVLEHLLFASLLENSHYAAAEEAFAAMVHTFFDWNEVRVSSVRELAEVVAGLPQPAVAAHHVKRVLQSLFEATYSFDLEDLRKLNLGPAVERLGKIDGTTHFSIAYLVQAALGGHSIPTDSGTLRVLVLAGLISEQDAAAETVPGLERAIPKNAGVEFGSLLHQLGADFVASPFTPSLHAILLEIDPTVKDRLPRRRDAKTSPAATGPASPGPQGPEASKKTPRRSAAKPETKGQEPKAKEEAKEKDRVQGKEDAAGKARPAVAEAPSHASPAEGKKPLAKPKKPSVVAKPKSVQATGAGQSPPDETAARGESVHRPPSSAGKKKPVAKKTAAKRPTEPANPKTESDADRHDPGVEGLSKRKPR